jgi:DNA-3-methyladenine glycosylase
VYVSVARAMRSSGICLKERERVCFVMRSRENPEGKEAGAVLPVSFYEQDTVSAAQGLLGCFLDHRGGSGRVTGRIVETEAYIHGDEAAHSFKGKTKRTRILFGPVGHAYVYFVYGMHCCLNAVTGGEGAGEAVLIRALEPVGGIEIMQQRRGTTELQSLCSGPGKLTQACGITLECNGISLAESPLRILSPAGLPGFVFVEEPDIVRTRRIGITKSADLPLRFMIRRNRFVSQREK